MATRIAYRTVDATGKEVAHGEMPNRRSRARLFHECQEQFGHCLAAIVPKGMEDKTWVFSQCIKGLGGSDCSIRITSVWKEEM